MLDWVSEHIVATIIIGIVLVIVILTVIPGLTRNVLIGNRQMGFDFTQTFRWAAIELGNGELIEGEVESWRDYSESDTVQLTIDGITYLTHYSKVILQTQAP